MKSMPERKEKENSEGNRGKICEKIIDLEG
jgi:hypothetical protein